MALEQRRQHLLQPGQDATPPPTLVGQPIARRKVVDERALSVPTSRGSVKETWLSSLKENERLSKLVVRIVPQRPIGQAHRASAQEAPLPVSTMEQQVQDHLAQDAT